MNGYVKLWRKISESNIWTAEPFTRGQAWIDLVLLANHKDGYIYVRGNKVLVPRGTVGWSENSLSSRWKWSRGKTRRFLADLASEKEEKIVQQKSKLTSLIQIINYEQYQGNGTTDGTTDGQQTDNRRYTNKNDKNEKNKNICAADDRIPYQEIIEHLNTKASTAFDHNSKETRRLIKIVWNHGARVWENGYTVDDFKAVIDAKCGEWLNSIKSDGSPMRQYLRPKTLFNKSNFESYFNSIAAR